MNHGQAHPAAKIILKKFSQFGSWGISRRSSAERGKTNDHPAFADAKGGEKMKPYSHEEHIRHTFPHLCVDEDLRRRLETKLITKILTFRVN